ncbi:hypothetical protein [Corallibacter sp.]|uniref:hypothetical protein n=1 Tax=Corallibacter sp. TaxID=2038084 RepID=UPI003AB24644
MKKLLLLFLLIAGKTTLASNSLNNTRVVYYSTVEFAETPLSEIKGSIPLHKDIAIKRNHYRFEYDELNRLKTISFFNGKEPQHPNHTANLFTLAHRMEFTYANKSEHINFFDIRGNPVDVLDNVHRFTYKLNELGYRSQLIFFNENHEQVENGWNIFEYNWAYHSDGSIIETRVNKNGDEVAIRPGFEFYRLHLFFNIKGHIALMQQIDANGNMIENESGAAQDNITTNAYGNFIKWEVLDKNHQLEKGNGPDIAIGIQTFNEFGYETGLEHRDENNKLVYSAYGICISKTQFDAFGNIKERRFYGPDSKPANHEFAGYHSLKIQWDATGNRRTSLTYYGLDGQPTLHKSRGYHKVTYEYTKKGLLKKIRYLDINLNLVNRMDNGVAQIVYDYNKKGKLVSTERFNTKHQKVN